MVAIHDRRAAGGPRAPNDGTPEVIARIGRDLRYLEINDAVESVTGLVPESFIGKRNSELGFPPAQVVRADAAVTRAFETGLQVRYEFELETPTGLRSFESLIVPEAHGGHPPSAVFSVTRDITHAKLIGELLRRAQDQHFLAEASTLLASTLDESLILEQVAGLAIMALADWCFVDDLRPDGSVGLATLAHGDAGKLAVARRLGDRLRSPDQDAAVDRIIRGGPPELMLARSAGAGESPAQEPEQRALLSTLAQRSAMVVPIKGRTAVFGCLTLVATGGAHYGEADLALATDLGRRAGLALDNAQLFQAERHSREEAERATLRATQLQALSGALANVLTAGDAARVMLTGTRRALKADAGYVWLLDGSGHNLVMTANEGRDRPLLESDLTLALAADLPVCEAVRLARPVFLPSRAARVRFPTLGDGKNSRCEAWAAVPLLVEGRAVGGLGLCFGTAGDLPHEDLDLMMAMGAQGAQVIERTRLFEAERRARADAEASERNYRFLAEAMPQLVWSTRPDGGNDYANQNCLDYMGISLAELAGSGWLGVVHPDDRERSGARWMQSIATATPFETTYRLRRADGEYRWFLSRARPQRDGAGVVQRWMGTCTDIHEQKLAEAARLQSEERLRVALAAADMGTWRLDLARGERTIDANLSQLLGGPAVETAQQRTDFLNHHVHADDRDRVQTAVEIAIRTGAPYDQEHRVVSPDGTVRWVRDRGKVFGDDTGAPVYMTGAMVDVTELRRAEARVVSESRVNETLYRLGVSFAKVLDEQRLIQLVTDEATSLTGAELGAFFLNVADEHGDQLMLSALAGIPAAALGTLPRLPRATPFFEPIFRGERILRYDDVKQAPNYGLWGGLPENHPPVTSLLAVPLMTRSGQVLGSLLFGHKLAAQFTEEHERMIAGLSAQAAIAIENARLYTALRRSERETKDAFEAAKLAERRKDEFLAMLGHELRNPLAPISTALQLMKLRDAGVAEREREVIERQVDHMSRLVDDLLDVSRITQGKIELDKDVIELSAIVEQALEMASPLLERRQQALEVLVPRRGLEVHADATRMAQVLANLLTNAAKYTPAGGSIRVTAWRDGQSILIRVKDSGMGIGPHLLPHVFNLFVQGDRSLDRAEGGLGLGLTLVHSLVELHEGSVEAASEGVGKGSEFTVRLPVATQTRKGAVKPGTGPVGRLQRELSPSRRILVVDDNGDAAEMLAEIMTAMGHVVMVSHDGPGALAIVRDFKPEFALLDIGLPVMDGYELAARLREALPGLPLRLIAVTGYGQEGDRRRAREAGFDEHFVKPLDLRRLEKALTVAPVATP